MDNRKKYGPGGDNYDQSWMGWMFVRVIIYCILIAAGICWITSCNRKTTETLIKIEYRDRVVHDTATVEIPVEVEKVVTRDTMSHLENTYAKSDAVVSGGTLSHSLESKPKIIKVPVEVHVTDTIKVEKEAQIIEKEVKVEKTLSSWKKFRLDAFWWLAGAVLLLLIWTFRKFIVKLFAL